MYMLKYRYTDRKTEE